MLPIRSKVRRVVRIVALCLVALQATPAPAASPCGVPLAGVNFAGGEFNGGKENARYAFDYIYPGAGEIALMQRLGLKAMRVPFLWERLQPQPLAPLDPAELSRLDEVVALARKAGVVVVLDAHNYGTYRGVSLDKPASPKGALPDLWKRLATHYLADRHVAFGLMNEPKDIDVDAWAEIARTSLAAIRSTGATQVVLVPGTHWDGAHSWFDGAPGHSNADALLPLAQHDDHVVFEVHQYFDDNFSGTAETCGAGARVPAALRRVGAWARTNHVRVMLGEFGVSQRPECVKALDDALKSVEEDHDVWWGWTYWSAGAWWGTYPLNIQTPDGNAPQGRVLQQRAAALDRMSCTPSR